MFVPHWNKIIKKVKGHKETFGGDDEYVYHLDGGIGITGICKCPNSSNCVN